LNSFSKDAIYAYDLRTPVEPASPKTRLFDYREDGHVAIEARQQRSIFPLIQKIAKGE
jgi:hypothetical protein